MHIVASDAQHRLENTIVHNPPGHRNGGRRAGQAAAAGGRGIDSDNRPIQGEPPLAALPNGQGAPPRLAPPRVTGTRPHSRRRALRPRPTPLAPALSFELQTLQSEHGMLGAIAQKFFEMKNAAKIRVLSMILVAQGRLVGHRKNKVAANAWKADGMMLHVGVYPPACGRGLVSKRIRLDLMRFMWWSNTSPSTSLSLSRTCTLSASGFHSGL